MIELEAGHEAALNASLQEQREALEKHNETALNAEKARAFEERQLDVFGGDLPADWAQQIARDPNLIAKVARRVCRHFQHARRSTGRVPDEALDAYGRALCAIYERLAGQPITYGTRTNLEADPPQAERTGLGLAFVRAGLKLIDPETTVSQAQRHIDRYKRWRD